MAKLNPFSFDRGPVTIITALVYLATLTALIVIQSTVPSAPSTSTPVYGVNLSEAWLDLQLLTRSYHPYNSPANDDVGSWLIGRIESIVSENKGSAYIFNDTSCNVTSSVAGSNILPAGITTYFESTNIIVYIPGEEDDREQWWRKDGEPSRKNCILVNAHYDSVSSGYGATDDGVGVITILQLIRYYTTKRNQPRNGLVLLLNNGEEDFLNGATAFSQHPMSRVVSAFLNLEGAGAGGRATLFRSTNVGVTRAYSKAAHPFGSVISGDGFERGFIASQTDYVIFNGKMGLPGLDVAFFEPRARYHTSSDSSRHTNRDSVWHMLEAALATTKSLTNSVDDDESPGVWFDMFGLTFAVFRLHTLFAISVTLLVVAPITLASTMVALYRADKLYMFSGSSHVHTPDADEPMLLQGWRGFFRFPLVLLVSCAVPVALAYLLFKENPFIGHSSEWAIWSMMVSSFVFFAWFMSRVADYARPSALTRAYGWMWMFLAWWVFLVFAAVFETEQHLAGTYFIPIYFAAVFMATWTSWLELFSLPKKSTFCKHQRDEPTEPTARPSTDEDEPSESSALLGERGRSNLRKYTQTDQDQPDEEDHTRQEQEWSKSQWSTLWLVQFILLAPINLILLGQIALIIVAALHQTGADGGSMFTVYFAIAAFTVLLFSPIVPLIHRFTWHIPIFMLLVLAGTLIYNLTAFPFSPQNRLKLYFQQSIDLDTGVNNVTLTGVDSYVQNAISYLPSAAGKSVNCTVGERSPNLVQCSWHGLSPTVNDLDYSEWMTYNVTSTSAKSARFTITAGPNSRACKIVLPDHPLKSVRVHGAAENDSRFPPVPSAGSRELRLWSRTWNRTWIADVEWKSKGNATGKVVCLWSDVNQHGVISAYDEAMHYVPEWVAMTKGGDGLVEAWKEFTI